MSYSAPLHASLEAWITRDALPFTDDEESFTRALDQLIRSLPSEVELLGFGEALHGGEEILLLRNRIFRHLVQHFGYTSIAIESSFTRGHAANEYVAGRGAGSFEEIKELGFSHGFGTIDANRELVEWMRAYNAEVAPSQQLRFYGFDIPGLTAGISAPRPTVLFALDYLCRHHEAMGAELRAKIEPVLGDDAAWENPAAMADPAQSIGLSPLAASLRLAVEALIAELRARRPELVIQSGEEAFLEALQFAIVGRELLNFHAASADKKDDLYSRLMAIRDALMADTLEYIAHREHPRGQVFVFAHNSHLQRGQAIWPWAAWWPAGAHLHQRLGSRYAVIGSALGESADNGIAPPEPGTLEASLAELPGIGAFLPTYRGNSLPPEETATLPVRSASTRNPGFLPLSASSLEHFDWLAFVKTTAYHRGGRPLPPAR